MVKLGPIGAHGFERAFRSVQQNAGNSFIFKRFRRFQRLEKTAGRKDHTILPYAGCAGRVRVAVAHGVPALQTAFAPMPPASTTSHPACRDDHDSAPRPGWDGPLYENPKYG